ncbi:hypothetical protein B0T17DRAFT_503785 [Bombardia bombarda]|uniref:Uncharacterized protein n=1 Tax=Bombardia bombarda TaxID=252184 RepID=A0AA39XLN5_9PEZI|nr:hypothetical protein B0T17DRAFT_503785 [Bombardia bombarda]
MCQSHSRETLTIPINGSRATWGSEMGSSAARPSQSAPNPSKRLSESDKNCPQVIRKSVQKSQFMHQNMTSHVVGQPASPTSPMLAHPRLSAHSPPDTPVRLRGGDSPMKKKIKLSDSPTDAPEYRPNGIEPLGNGRGKAVKSQTAQSSGHPPNGSLRRTAKPLPHGNKRLEKTKLGAVRKMASAVPLAALNGLARVHFTDGQPGKESGDDADILVCENKDAISDHQLYGRRIGEQHALLKHTPNGHASSREPSWPKTFAMQEEEPQPSREARVVDEAVFDNMVYSQERAIQRPPPEVKPLCIKPKPDPTSEAKFIDINPVVHYNQLRSEKWYEDKLAEIQERGGRKTRFGRAAERMREQRLKEGPQPIERTIPWQILENEKWMKARARLEALLPEKSVKQPDRTKQVRQGLKPGPKLGHKKPGPKPGQKRQQKLANMVPSNP